MNKKYLVKPVLMLFLSMLVFPQVLQADNSNLLGDTKKTLPDIQIPEIPEIPGIPSADSKYSLDTNQKFGYAQGRRNPFAPTRQILSMVNRAGAGKGNFNIQPMQDMTKVPRMHLKGLISDGDNSLAALLEIENAGIYMVREGDTVGLYESGSSSVIQIRKINRLNIVVEAGSLGEVLIIR